MSTEKEPVTIASLEMENVKRVRAVALEPSPKGLTVIGGRNAQGKTSVLDAIAWALGGGKRKPARPNREGSATPAKLHVELSNGLVVERKGKNGSLTVTDPSGKKAGQTLLDGLIEELALDLPKFMAMSDSDKANVLLGIIGVGEELAALDRKVKSTEERRRDVGREERAKREMASKMPRYADAPDEPVSAMQLIEEQQEILARNGENQRKRSDAERYGRVLNDARARVKACEEALRRAQRDLTEAQDAERRASDDYTTASKGIEQLRDESTVEVEARLREIDQTNERVRANQRARECAEQAEQLKAEYDGLTATIRGLRNERAKLLEGADMPLEGLTVEDGKLVFGGSTWGDMSASEQMRVATAIVHAIKPGCGFVLLDKLEQLDTQTLSEFGAWAESEGLQIIGTRVATDESCTVVIEDGRIAGQKFEEGAGETHANAAEPALAEVVDTQKPSPFQMGVF